MSVDGVINALKNREDEERLRSILDATSKLLARDEPLREQLGLDTRLWQYLETQWRNMSVEAEDEVDIPIALSLARFTRNLVAGVPRNQQQAYAFEKHIRNVLYYQTSYIKLHDDSALPLTRMLVQTLSNIITANETLLSSFWIVHLGLPEQRNILIRLLQADDEATITSTLILAYNCLHDSAARRSLLLDSVGGKRVLVLLLDRTNHNFERQDDSAAFKIAYQLFEHLFDNDLAPSLWQALQPSSQIQPV